MASSRSLTIAKHTVWLASAILAVTCGLFPPPAAVGAGDSPDRGRRQGQIAYGPAPALGEIPPDSGQAGVEARRPAAPWVSLRGGYGVVDSDLFENRTWIAIGLGWPSADARRRIDLVLSHGRPGSRSPRLGPDPRLSEWGIGVEGRTAPATGERYPGLQFLAGMQVGLLRFNVASPHGPVIGAPDGFGSAPGTARDAFLTFTPYAGAAVRILNGNPVSIGVRATAGVTAIAPRSFREGVLYGAGAPAFFLEVGLELTATSWRRPPAANGTSG